MKYRKLIIMEIIGILAISTFGCASATKEESYNMLQESTEIELEYAEFETIDDKEVSSLDWIELGSLTTYKDLRASWDSILGITGTTGNKEGILYKGWQGATQDNYLGQVISMQDFVKFAADDDNYNALVDAVRDNFTDSDNLSDQQLFSIGLNAYFNLLPMADEGETHADDYVSRAQFLALITRATCPVSIETTDTYKANLSQLEALAGDSIYNESVAMSLQYGYLTTEDGSLNDKTYDSAISRGEAIYTIMKMIYGEDELARADIDSAELTDATNGGDIKAEQNFKSNAQVIQYAIQNPDKGCPEDIYRALVKLNETGLIGSETSWDEAITLSDAVSLYYDITVSRFCTGSTTTDDNNTAGSTASETNDKIAESKSWPEYKETMEYYIEKGIFSEERAHMMNPDIYGTETAGKAIGDFDTGTGDPSSTKYIKDLKLTTTKGYNVWAYWFTDTNTVMYVYTGEVSPYGSWKIDSDSSYALAAAYSNKPVTDITHQQKIDALGAPSMTAEEVIAALQ